MISTVIYNGDLRTVATHVQSGNSIITDAPLDNNGKGEAFSPTDLVATALASCMITVMGIVAKRDNITGIDGAKAEVTKVMFSEPRRIGEIHVKLVMPPNNYSEREKKILEHTAYTCPVSKSLDPELKQSIEFIW